MFETRHTSRRDFLRLGSSVLAPAGAPPLPLPPEDAATRSQSRWGRVITWSAWIQSEPDPQAPRVSNRGNDDIVNILEEAEGHWEAMAV